MTEMLSLWRGWIGRPPARTAVAIAGTVAEAHGLTLQALRTASRRADIARARQEAMAALRAQTRPDGRPRYSFPWIARFFALSHPTVIHGVRTHRRRVASDGRP
jgi:chromosomal replication initiation ATPase DnaA